MDNIRKVSLALTSVCGLAASLAAAPAFADGECVSWNVAGTWRVHQSNGINVLLRLQQNDQLLSGVGEYSYFDNDARKERTVSGPIDGQLDNGSLVRVSVYWSNGAVGLYVGTVLPDGRMEGYSHERADVNNKATITGGGYPHCLAHAAPPPPPPPPKPTMALGRVRVPEGTPPSPPMTMCERAAAARAANRPTAAALQQRCDAERAALPSLASGRVSTPVEEALAVGPPYREAQESALAKASLIAPPLVPTVTTPLPTVAAASPPIDPAQLDALAAKGAEIAGIDPPVDEARHVEAGAFYQLGFDIATGLFGDPMLGAAGKAKMDASLESIRDSLSASGQRGFDASMKFHLTRD